MTQISDLQRRIGEVNTANGWRADTTTMGEDALANYQITKLALITTEVAEAIEEVRDGHPVHITYYPDGEKPEGVPSELADIVIRALDCADMWGIDLESIIEEKLAYNITRGHRHGGKVA